MANPIEPMPVLHPQAAEAKPSDAPLSAQHLDMLLREADRMQTFYLDAMNNAQGIFNFYLTFVTAVIGGLVIILQNAGGAAPAQIQLMFSALLFFSVLVGSVYVSSLSGRYAHAARFAYTLDAIRREILQKTGTPMPPIYDDFLNAPAVSGKPQTTSHWMWLLPSGTFQMFMAIINALALSASVLLLVNAVGGDLQVNITAGVLLFFVTLTIYNIYSHMVIARFSTKLDVRVDMSGRLSA